MDASETDGSKQKSSRHARIRVWVRVDVIYGIWGTEYLTEGVLGADGAHACGLVFVVKDGGVVKTVEADTLGDPRRARF